MKRLSYANVMATIAVFVAIGGGAYAAGVARHSVGTQQLKDDAVISKKVEDGSLLGADFATGQLPQGPKGDAGATGPAGVRGATGPAGLAGGTHVIRRPGTLYTISPGTPATLTAFCNTGETVVGGGAYDVSGTAADIQLMASYPAIGGDTTSTGTPTEWRTRYRNADTDNNHTGAIEVRTFALCATP